jgi:hypothetical protein
MPGEWLGLSRSIAALLQMTIQVEPLPVLRWRRSRLGRVAVWPDAAPAAILSLDKAQSCSVHHERTATPYCGKMAPGPKGCGPQVNKLGAPPGVAGLDRRMTAAGALRLVWHYFGLQRGAAPNGNTP